MTKVGFIVLCCCLIGKGSLFAQTLRLDNNSLLPVSVSATATTLHGKDVVKVIKDLSVTGFDEPTFAILKNVRLKNGIIEAKVFSRLLPNAPAMARGFIGIAFRVNDSANKFECLYIRPTNGRAEDQLRRNHTIQYFSYPAYKYERLRKEAPGEYESYADMGLNEWITIKIVVKGAKAQLYLNNNKQPALIVNDLKQGTDVSGGIGLWVDIGTEGFFSDLKVTQQD